jgi:hypothetical protein
MKLRRKRRTRTWLAVVAVAALTPVIALSLQNPGNIAQTRSDHVDPQLRTRHYSHSLEQVSQVVREIIPQLKTYGGRWRRIQQNGLMSLRLPGEMGTKTEIAEVPVLVFTDDLVVTMRGDDKQTTVDVRSASRVGRSDLGENRRHILQLLHALGQKLNTR